MSEQDILKTLETADGAPDNPYDLFGVWMSDAEKSEPSDPNAMSLATISEKRVPEVRIVLLKGIDERGFVFYTNSNSQKGAALNTNPVAALCFHWKTLGRQVRVQGRITAVSKEEADEYYNSRHRGSRIGAWASQQSQMLESRSELQARVKEYEEKFEGQDDIPRPPHWNGYRVVPDKIEFWHDGAYRLHTRVEYENIDGKWHRKMLYP